MKTHRQTTIVTAATLAALGPSVTVGLVMSLPTTPSAPSVAATMSWWGEVGTPAAAMTLVHVGAVALALWVSVAALAGLMAGIHPSRMALVVWQWVSTPAVRRAVGGTLLAATTSVPTAAFADDTDPEVEEVDDFVLEDRGPTTDDRIMLVDIGPIATPVFGHRDGPIADSRAEPPMTASDTHVETWTIERGDHLWRIAEETVRDRGATTTISAVTHYWRRLIEANRDIVGDNPDLVYPGQIVRLPD